MKVVLDTNVLVSGLFFGGLPGQILSAWNAGSISFVLSASILAEYREVGAELNARHNELDFESFAALLVMHSEIVDAPEYLDPPVCADRTDDTFLSCALVSGAGIVVSGDRRLLATSGWNGIEMLRPRTFVEQYM